MRRYRGNSRGFSLLEVLVSLSIFSIAAMAVTRAFTSQLTLNNLNEARSDAVFAAERVLDELRLKDPATMPPSGGDPERVVRIGPRTFVIRVNYCAPATYCASNSVRAIHLETRLHGKVYYEVDTVFVQLR